MKKKTIKTFLLTLFLTLLFSMTVFAEEAQQTATMYATANVNVREGDSASTRLLGILTKGQSVTTTGMTAKGWYTIDYNGKTGYVSGKYLTDNTTPAPATTPAQASNGATRTFSNGVTFVQRGQTPGGLDIWYLSDDDGTWEDYMIAAYDATGITNEMSDYDKAVAINNYICRVVDYAEVGADDRATYCACLTSGQAICMGYSHAFDCLCTMAGVYSNEVLGYTNGAHSWNYVLIGDTKYWVDVCWNDGTNNAYLMSTSQFADHTYSYEK